MGRRRPESWSDHLINRGFNLAVSFTETRPAGGSPLSPPDDIPKPFPRPRRAASDLAAGYLRPICRATPTLRPAAGSPGHPRGPRSGSRRLGVEGGVMWEVMKGLTLAYGEPEIVPDQRNPEEVHRWAHSCGASVLADAACGCAGPEQESLHRVRSEHLGGSSGRNGDGHSCGRRPKGPRLPESAPRLQRLAGGEEIACIGSLMEDSIPSRYLSRYLLIS